MVVSQELQLGNLVLAPALWNDQYFNVMELYSDECSVSPTGKNEARMVSYQELEPIVVTASLLEHLGFEIETHGLHKFVRQQGIHWLYLNSDLQPVVSPSVPVPLSSYRISYLHQLQNLFYIITGKALSVLAPPR